MQGLGTSVIGANDCWEEQVDLAEVESTADGDQVVGLQADAQGMERPTWPASRPEPAVRVVGPAPDGRIAGPLPHTRRATVNPRRELVVILPGMAPNAPKRNVLVSYGYLFVTTLALTVVHLI